MSDNINVPGVYRGTQKLATQNDLALLRQELHKVIAGPISEISKNGYIPWKFNNDGTLDIEYLFPELLKEFNENTGITITKNGVKLSSEVKTLNFTGNFVYFDLDENGNLTIDIRAPKQEVSRFNSVDGVTDSLIKIKNEIISGMIIPDTSALTANPIYGDWEAGSIHKGINWNGDDGYDPLEFYTNENIFTSDLESFFEVFIYNGYGEVVASFKTKSVTGNTRSEDGLTSISTGYNYHIKIKIKDFKEENNGYSFKPIFDINLIGIFGKSGSRFHVKIIHHDGQYINQYVSEDYLYNVGQVPQLTNYYYDVVTNNLTAGENFVSTWCSGLKYIIKGNVTFNVQEIRYLNKLAATKNKVTYFFKNINLEKTSKTAELINYDLSLNTLPSWSITLYPDNNIFKNTETSGYIFASNAFGNSEKMNVKVPILINTAYQNLKLSDNLHEYFNNEDYRVSNEFSQTISNGIRTLTRWDSGRSLKDYEEGTGLMVIPTSGLTFPFGDWSSFIPAGSPDYDDLSFIAKEKFYSRVFTGNDELKFGGIFTFEGITKEEFLDSRLTCIISPDQGLNWYSLKDIRNTTLTLTRDTGNTIPVTGILTKIKETVDGIQVFWEYPGAECSNNPIYFQIGFKPTSNFLIKSISLCGLDGKEGW